MNSFIENNMAIRCLLLLLPALALAKIEVEIGGKFDPQNPNIQVYLTGIDIDIISNDERKTFNIEDYNLKSAVDKYFGKRPNDAYVRSPTPWGDLYTTYGWEQVKRTLVPKSSRVLGIKSQPTIVMEQTFINNSTKTGTFNVGISQEVENTATSSWSTGGKFTVEQKIEYSVDLEVAEVGGTTSFSYTNSWGQNAEKSQTVTVGSSSAVEIVLEPGQSVISRLEATRGTVQIEVEYVATLSGRTAINYSNPYQGHHFWGLDIKEVMSSGGISNSIVSKEVIEIGFYANSRVSVHDKLAGNILLSIPV